MGGGAQVCLCVGCSLGSGRPVVTVLHQYTHPEHRAVAQNGCAPLLDTAPAGSRHGQATDLFVMLQLEELWYEEKYRQDIQIHTRTASDLPMICCSGCTCKSGERNHRLTGGRSRLVDQISVIRQTLPCKGTNTQPSALSLTVGFPCGFADCTPPHWHSRQSSLTARTSSGGHCRRPCCSRRLVSETKDCMSGKTALFKHSTPYVS